jgi:hypothetical protein
MDIKMWQDAAMTAAEVKIVDIIDVMNNANNRTSMNNVQVFQEIVQRLCQIQLALRDADFEPERN